VPPRETLLTFVSQTKAAKPVKISVASAGFPCVPLRHIYIKSPYHCKKIIFSWYMSFLENMLITWSYLPFNKYIQLIFTFQKNSDQKFIAELQKHAHKLLSKCCWNTSNSCIHLLLRTCRFLLILCNCVSLTSVK